MDGKDRTYSSIVNLYGTWWKDSRLKKHRSGKHRSAEEALDAAVAAVEIAAAPDFEGTQEELEELLLEASIPASQSR